MTREDKLIRRMEAGDRSAADELVRLLYPEILRYCLWHAPNRSMAEDAVQETFLKAVRYFDRYIHKGKFKAFLYQIAANTCIDMSRRKSLSDISIEDLSRESSYHETGFDETESDLALRQYIELLPEEQREVVILHFSQDLTIRETAEILDIPLRSFLILQIRHMGWKIWAMQGILLALINGVLAVSFGKYYWGNQRYVSELLCFSSILVLMTALPFIQRALRFRMNEVEAATWFSSARLLLAKLLIIGVGDLLMLGGILCTTILKTSINASGVILYLTFPFLLACGGLLFLLDHIPARLFLPGSTGMCGALLLMLFIINRICPAFYHQNFFLAWGIVCLGLIVCNVFQINRIIKRSAFAEMQLT